MAKQAQNIKKKKLKKKKTYFKKIGYNRLLAV